MEHAGRCPDVLGTTLTPGQGHPVLRCEGAAGPRHRRVSTMQRRSRGVSQAFRDEEIHGGTMSQGLYDEDELPRFGAHGSRALC